VIICGNVWIAPKATIMKGVTINSGSVVSYQAVVTKDVPSNVIVGGIPAKVIKSNINWGRHIISV
jgi:acetyltransferase-like isoleucine patch superfamily enzyme